jgi:hypothetical protein
MSKEIELHMIRREHIDVFKTLKLFKPLECAFILHEDSNMATESISSRYRALRKQGLIDGEFSFYKSQHPLGTIIFRRA